MTLLLLAGARHDLVARPDLAVSCTREDAILGPAGCSDCVPEAPLSFVYFQNPFVFVGIPLKTPESRSNGSPIVCPTKRLELQKSKIRSLDYAYVVSHPKSKEGRVAGKMGTHTCAQLCALSDGRAPCVGSMWCGSTDRRRWSETNKCVVYFI